MDNSSLFGMNITSESRFRQLGLSKIRVKTNFGLDIQILTRSNCPTRTYQWSLLYIFLFLLIYIIRATFHVCMDIKLKSKRQPLKAKWLVGMHIMKEGQKQEQSAGRTFGRLRESNKAAWRHTWPTGIVALPLLILRMLPCPTLFLLELYTFLTDLTYFSPSGSSLLTFIICYNYWVELLWSD